ncbi:MAG: bifunctional diaminohydroxyphosphoribosylaminopyrimidine deaminase/5-amino-6-(5-phosphoribosylamino)uracil reductase RibD [Dehalococcoidia bacterium]|nr:MAG: bifunctional diaminohydroxyphosphoribosylaminopyrimidine deaminase/5-amino-6-(5-phosphoribosylamino)uracil reductase RibD [Dehalococcoidia bacterium]
MNYMEQALSLARLALGQVSPNPAVGALVVKDGEIVGRGYTQPPGSDHAEVVALEQADNKTKGSIMYVTLEPCRHRGRTPPCSDAIIASGIIEVHIAMLDPNPIVSGKGKTELEAAGIHVIVGECRQEARDLNEAYIKHITTGIPYITVKYAMSLDGKIATHSSDSKWISNEESRHYAHKLRYTNDAIMTGVNTILADNPHLTARCCGGRGGTAKKQPLRIIIDNEGRMPQTAQLFKEPGETLLVLGRQLREKEAEGYRRLGAETLVLPSSNDCIDLKKLFKKLGERGITSVLVEGGSILHGSIFDQGLADKVVAFIAPIIIGGEKAKTAVAGKGVTKVIDSSKLKRISIERFGQDIMISGYVAPVSS